MGASKDKGNKFERSVAFDLTSIFGEDFSRTISSGAYIGGKNYHRRSKVSNSMVQASLGDICTPDDWSFVIECKAYKDFNFHMLLQGYCNQLGIWLDEVLFDADYQDNHMLVFKINLVGTYFALPYSKEFHDTMIESGISHSLYTHYYGKEQENLKLYIITDWLNLKGAYNEYAPEVQKVLMDYIRRLAGKEL